MKKITEWYYGISLKDRFKQRTYDAIMGRNMLTAELMLLIASATAIFIDANSLKMITASTWILLLVTVVIGLMNTVSLHYYRLQVIEVDTPEAYHQYVWLAVARGVLSALMLAVAIFAIEMAYEAAMDMNPLPQYYLTNHFWIGVMLPIAYGICRFGYGYLHLHGTWEHKKDTEDND
ncbi:hypothetical protein FD51_GL001215 [Lacticaseibacillus zeae DSM 20178 = KCTC 3804]|uniref:DUF3278 domain-containing protein n=2 Tax=Lacticaseibacillus zeae TaxID=57037 RepID=A0A5R8LXA3_LACZE|nr:MULTISPECIES: hypothetical protein [Lacticaseibacillus]KRK11257.1 hypothetical protein FD51_GL001215 [Lacticaseibacillus zeae DSM 20178 = KCTC 3804]MDE3283213.1 hypothetical protein [Lacticaseibacillus casei]OLS07391.1 hypothetical protein AUQ39_09045 [Lacticaseibacillus casei]QVI31376.1 hypothetical protein KG087_10655 [Lacticaseibacillus zeae]TLF41924.1 hypothetical protein FEI15_01570 [Lacticaseibacillus zeae]